MNFLNPTLLLGILGVSLPILAHILNKHQYKTTKWAAMQFLNRAVRIRSKQIKLKDIILLILRCLALIFLALALSRPTLQKGESKPIITGEKRTAITIALDTSFSMLHSNGSSTRLALAKAKIEQICKNINPGDPVSLITLADEHKVIIRNMAFNEQRFLDILDTIEASAEPLKTETIHSELRKIAEGIETLQKEIYLVSDMQNKDWKTHSSWSKKAYKELNEIARIFIVPIEGSDDNLSISNIELFSGVFRKGTIARYLTTVKNNSSKAKTNIAVDCLVNGINVDRKVIPVISAKSSQTVSFFIPFHNAGPAKITASLKNDSLNLDNVRRTVANIRDKVSVLCVEGSTYGNSLESFISKAIQARGARTEREDFKVRSISWLSLPSQDLNNFDIVILSDIPEIGDKQALQLRDFVKKGNGLIWFGGENVKIKAWNKRTNFKEGPPLLPAIIGDAIKLNDHDSTGLTIEPSLSEHAICKPLQSLPKDLLGEAQFQNIHKMTLASSASKVLNLSGSEDPLLIEQSLGRGHVFMFSSTSNPTWNNMALTPIFPMILQQMVTYLTGRKFEKDTLVGSPIALSYSERPDANNGIFESPSGDMFDVPVKQFGSQYVARIDKTKEVGFYLAKVSLQSPGIPIAVNLHPDESDVSNLSMPELNKSFKGTGVTISKSVDELIDEVNSFRNGYEYWRTFLILVLVTLIIESLLAANPFRKGSGTTNNSSSVSTGGNN